MLIKRFNSQI